MTLLRADLLRDLLFLYNPLKQQLHTCMSVSWAVPRRRVGMHAAASSSCTPALSVGPS